MKGGIIDNSSRSSGGAAAPKREPAQLHGPHNQGASQLDVAHAL